MFLFRKPRRARSEDPDGHDDGRRLPLRWGLIILASSSAAVAVGSVAGLPLAIGTWIAVAVGLDQLLA